MRKLVLGAVAAFAMVTGFSPPAHATCEPGDVVCEVYEKAGCQGCPTCVDSDCLACFDNAYIYGIGPINFCPLPHGN